VDPNPSWLGYSIGRWDKDTLVVETIGFNNKAPLDISGHPRSESMRLTERYRRRDVGHLDVEITFDDPVVYTKPFTIKVTHLLQPDTDILEYFCNENEQDRAHLVGNLRDEKNGTMTFLIKNPSTLRLVDAKGDEMKSKLNYDLVRDQAYTPIDGFKP